MRSPERQEPAPGQESVWDYPRPAIAEHTPRRIRGWFAGQLIADSRAAWRVLETAHPPVYYLPRRDIEQGVLIPVSRRAFCEWKGQAHYFDLVKDGEIARAAAWAYPEPQAGFEPIAGHVAFHPRGLTAAMVDDMRAEPQPGRLYGGWVTPDIAGPFKGAPGSEYW